MVRDPYSIHARGPLDSGHASPMHAAGVRSIIRDLGLWRAQLQQQSIIVR